MIVGRAVCTILDDIDFANVKNNMGNQDALDKFIALSDKKQVSKYPLVFYVTSEVISDNGKWKHCNSELIIMMNTDSNMLYKERSDKTYLPYIDPIYYSIKTLFNQNSNIQVLAEHNEDKYPYTDVPNFGITKNEIGSKTSNNSVVTDYVDARIIKLNFKINTDCILNT